MIADSMDVESLLREFVSGTPTIRDASNQINLARSTEHSRYCELPYGVAARSKLTSAARSQPTSSGALARKTYFNLLIM